jgi:hypothetical protein
MSKIDEYKEKKAQFVVSKRWVKKIDIIKSCFNEVDWTENYHEMQPAPDYFLRFIEIAIIKNFYDGINQPADIFKLALQMQEEDLKRCAKIALKENEDFFSELKIDAE